MAELNAGVNLFQVNTSGANGKTAFTTDAPNSTGFGESTHHFAKTTDDMGIFVYSNEIMEIRQWQKIDGNWVDCGKTGSLARLPWNLSFAWRDGATHIMRSLLRRSARAYVIATPALRGSLFR